MKKTTILDIKRMKAEKRKISMVTCCDYTFAKIVDNCDVDIILVGDSLGTVVSGYSSTLQVTLDEMIYHTAYVSRGRQKTLLVGDMPFMSYQASIEDAKRNAGRFLSEGFAEAVKLEGGMNIASTIKAITNIDIPVMGHIGLTPQSIHRMGGYRIQGKDPSQREKLINDALAVEEAGAFGVVLEGIPASLAGEITEKLSIPTIGIGAGPRCDGQVLVLYDLLGLYQDFKPKFVKYFGNLQKDVEKAVKSYSKEVKKGAFPAREHSFE